MTGDVAYMYSQFGPYVVRRLEDMNNVGLDWQAKFATTDGSLDAPDCVPAGALGQDVWDKRLVLFVKVR